ncbi:protein of unknown function [Legionella fallonii LLAP-10]|uniref:Uncharacterized protein n=1 Tax=Legionella fallonii LLAP-10 TaxID=1212491 RepID=A0A098G9C5_9GAMM|nr:protein of unknown function [Legionella fallonii LLAP-10]
MTIEMSIWKGKKQRFAQRLIENIKEISFINKEGKLSYYGAPIFIAIILIITIA